MLRPMAKANPKSIQELEAQKKAIRDAAAAEVAAIRKATAAKVNALKILRAAFACARHPRSEAARQPRQDPCRRGHDPPVPGSRKGRLPSSRALLEEFYSDSPDRLKNALYGLSTRGQEAERRPGTGLS